MIRVFPHKTKWTPTDELVFVGSPPENRPPQMPVRVSVTFTWDIEEGQRLLKEWSQYYDDVQIGGPAFGDPGGEFVPGRFILQGVVITSRGCHKSCKWCFVPGREGAVREIEIKDGWIIQDNNLLACSRPHIEAVFAMLKKQPKAAVFKGGLDATLLKEWHRQLLDEIRVKELWFACDTPAGVKPLERVSKILEGIPRWKKFCYTMVGYKGESVKEAEQRLETVYSLGFMPFTQLYQGPERKYYSKDWRKLARTWSRPAGTKAYMKPLESFPLFSQTN